MSTVHIHAPRPCKRMVQWYVCQDCKKQSPFAILVYDWYGPEMTCMRCGRHYNEDGWCALDFIRNSRQISKESARKAWKRALK